MHTDYPALSLQGSVRQHINPRTMGYTIVSINMPHFACAPVFALPLISVSAVSRRNIRTDLQGAVASMERTLC